MKMTGSQPPDLPTLTSDATLDAAYAWLCRQRREHGPNSDVWHLRFLWSEVKARLRRELRTGGFKLGPTRRFTDAEGERRECRAAIGALVLRALAQTLTPVLEPQIPAACTHIAGHSGAKGAISQVLRTL